MTIAYLILLSCICLLGALRWKKIRRASKLLTYLIALTLLTEILAIYGRDLFFVNFFCLEETNSPYYHFIRYFQLYFFSAIYGFYFISLGYFKQKTIWIGSLLMLIISVEIVVQDSFCLYPSFSSVILGFYMVLLSLKLFSLMLKNPQALPLLKQAEFWFNCGNLFFYTSTIFIFGFYSDFIVYGKALPEWSILCLQVFNFLLYFTYLISLYVDTSFSPFTNLIKQ